MCFLNKLKTKTIFFSVGGTIFISLLIGTFYGLSKISEIDNLSKFQLNDSLPHTHQLIELQIDVIQIQQWISDISATRAAPGCEDGLIKAQNYYHHANTIIDQLIIGHTNSNEPLMVAALKKDKILLQKFHTTGVKMAHSYISEGLLAGNKIMSQFDPLASQLNTSIKRKVDQHIIENKNAVTKSSILTKNLADTALYIFLLTATIIVICALLIYKFISQIDTLNKKISKLATLDFSCQFNADTGSGCNEISQMAHNLQTVNDNIKNHIETEKELEMQNSKFTQLLEEITRQVPGTIYQFKLSLDGTTSFPFASTGILHLFGATPDELIIDGKKIFEQVIPADYDALFESIFKSADTLTNWNHEFRIYDTNKNIRWIGGTSTPQRIDDGSVLWHGFINDITHEKDEDEAQRVAATAFETQDAIIITDSDNIILRVNESFTKITGFLPQEVIGKTTKILASGKHNKTFYEEMWTHLLSEGKWEGEIWNKKHDGSLVLIQLRITSVKNATHEITNYVASMVDITVAKEASEKIKNLAFYDPLTQLPNRRLLVDRLEHYLNTLKRTQQYGAILFLDLDKFKDINDSLGHHSGDLLLKSVGERLISCVRETDTVSRFGGDEFVILLENLADNNLQSALAAEITAEKILSSLSSPHVIEGKEIFSTPSIGLTYFNQDTDDSQIILSQADMAMYHSKAAGRNTIRFFNKKMQETINTRINTEHEIIQGLSNNEFTIFLQPQVDDTGRVVGAEALSRWNHPVKGLVAPYKFISIAEDANLLPYIGEVVLDLACQQLDKFALNETTKDLTISINVSAKELSSTNFVSKILTKINSHSFNNKNLKLEITESSLIDRLEDTISKINHLQKHDIRFSLDDFGTGYSSLQYLKRLPISQLKIDKSFIDDIVSNDSDKAIVKTIITMSQGLGIDIIAEGVETAEQRDILFDKGCHFYQGYLFSEPLSIQDFETYLLQTNIKQSINKNRHKG